MILSNHLGGSSMSAVKKKDHYQLEDLSNYSSEDIQFMQDFLESLDSDMRNSSFFSLKRRIKRKQETKNYRGKKIAKDHSLDLFRS